MDQQRLTMVPEEGPWRESSPPIRSQAEGSDTEAGEDDDRMSHNSLGTAISRCIPRRVRETVSRSVTKGMSAVAGSKAAEGTDEGLWHVHMLLRKLFRTASAATIRVFALLAWPHGIGGPFTPVTCL